MRFRASTSGSSDYEDVVDAPTVDETMDTPMSGAIGNPLDGVTSGPAAGVADNTSLPPTVVIDREVLQTLLRNATGRPKAVLPDVERYTDEDRSQYPAFEASLRAKLATDGAAIGNETARMWYAFGRLSGRAAVRILPWMETYSVRPAEFTLESLYTHMRTAFRDHELEKKAQRKLGYMKQGNRGFADFLSEFDQTLLEARGHEWDDVVKKNYLQQGLSAELAKCMITVPEADEYGSYCQQLREVADKLASYTRRTARITQPNQPPRAARPSMNSLRKASPTPPRDPNAMDWEPHNNRSQRRAKWVSDDEMERRRRERLCLRCGASGHIIRQCPYRQARHPGSPPRLQPKVNKVEPLLEDDDVGGDAETLAEQGKE